MSTSEEGSVDNGLPKESHRPKNVPLRLWEKFQALEKRTNEVTKRSTEKRIKHLQKTALENVARACQHPDDQALVPALPPATDSRPSGQAASASLSSSTSLSAASSRKRRAGDMASAGESQEMKGAGKEAVSRPAGEREEEKQWQEVRGLLGVNEHLAGVSHGSLGPKTVLELRIDDAITRGDYRAAEELSDHMSSREFGEKVAKAIDAKNFLKHKQEEEERAKVKRRKKLHWGYEAKHRWETKSNM